MSSWVASIKMKSGICASLLPKIRALSSAPSVFDKFLTYALTYYPQVKRRIEVTVIDKVGRHHVLRGLEGQNVASLLEQHAETLGDDVIGSSPEGRGKGEAHVKVPNELMTMLPSPTSEEQRYLAEIAEGSSLDKHSRLASRIILDQRMQGALVSLSDLKPWKTL